MVSPTPSSLKTRRVRGDKSKSRSIADKLAELTQLPQLIKEKFKKWTDGGKPFQIQSMEAQVLGHDVVLQAATGSGKTGIAAGPHLLKSSKGKVTLYISPLIALQEEQVSTTE
jgi:ATP-dependent helicase YprA (DUF1998 family)